MEKILYELFEKIVLSDGNVYISGDGLPVTFQTKILELTDKYVCLQNTVPIHYISRFMGSKRFGLSASNLRAVSAKVQSDGKKILFFTGEEVNEGDQRVVERRPVHKRHNLKFKLLNPIDGETKLVKIVSDISIYGAAISSPNSSKLFEAGATFKQVELVRDDETLANVDIQVTYQRQVVDMKGTTMFLVGLKFAAPLAEKIVREL